MRNFLTALIAVAPLTIFGQYVGGKYISPSIAFATTIAFITILALLLHQYKIYKSQVKYLAYFYVFIIIGIVSIIRSPYVYQARSKGIIQIIGISIVLITTIAITNEIIRRPVFFLKLVRVSIITLGIIGGIGIAQFISFNVFGAEKFFNFSFMSNIAGGEVWGRPDKIGFFYRAHSICREPAIFAQSLGFGAGVALVRVGLLGKAYQKSLARIIPSWAAWLILLGFMVTISIVGYLLLIMITAFVRLVSNKLCLKASVGIFFPMIFISGIIYAVTQFAGPAFQDKVASIGLIVSTQSKGIRHKEDFVQLSALAIASNLEVMLGNLKHNPLLGAGLGAHPAAYEKLAPSYVYNRNFETGINAQGAASLLVRLLSETGIIGTSLFIVGFLVVIVQGRRAILWSLNKQVKGSKVSCPPFIPLAIGITASCAGVFIASLIKFSGYYDPQLWTLMALTACVPQLLGYYAIKQKRLFASARLA